MYTYILVDSRRLLPPRVSEVVGVSHLKCYIFDDDIIISGANISNTYFSTRQDRYFVVRNARLLAYHIRSLVQVGPWPCPSGLITTVWIGTAFDMPYLAHV